MLIDLQANLGFPKFPRKVLILGSTGSIGEAALDVIRQFPQRFKVTGLVAGSKVDKLLVQTQEFKPEFIGLANSHAAAGLKNSFHGRVLIGDDQICEALANVNVDLVIAAVVGVAGVNGVIHSLRNGKLVALANKESLVAAGKLIVDCLKSNNAKIVPVDSEHSAIFQLLRGENISDVSKLILTASGGPFRNLSLSELKNITPQQAIKHPTWQMGPKISVDSATMVNKALELIEAYWLFGLDANKIEVLIHPQSIVHSLVEFHDGNQLAQLSKPDMRGAIGFAMNYPSGRLANLVPKLKLSELKKLEFEDLDHNRFPAVKIAQACLTNGGNAPALFTILNDIAVEKFLTGRISFLDIISFIQSGLEQKWPDKLSSVEDLMALRENVIGKYINSD